MSSPRSRSAWLVGVALALLLARPARAGGDPRPIVAVIYFGYDRDDEMAVLRKGLASMLITDLSPVDKIRLVERERLEAIIAEQHLADQITIDPETAIKIGKVLQARYLVLGHYFVLAGRLQANARVVDTQTGAQVGHAKGIGAPGDFLEVEQQLARGLTEQLTALGPQAAPAAAPTTKPPARPAPPAQLKLPTALAYSRALDAIDKKDKPRAKKELTQVVKEQPDFKLAMLDLDRLMH